MGEFANETCIFDADDSEVVPLQCYDPLEHGPRCRDTYGYFEKSEFERWTCSKCFFHIFDVVSADDGGATRPPLAYDLSIGTMLYSMTDDGNLTAFEPDALQEDSILCHLFLNDDGCTRWRTCCQQAVRCCERQLQALAPAFESSSVSVPESTLGMGCSMTWDGFACWNATVPNTIAEQACPEYYQRVSTFQSLPMRATKWCTNDGWYNKFPHTAPLEWTNITLCIADESMAKAVLQATSTLSVFLHSVSIVLLLLCMVVILICRNAGSSVTRLMLKVHFVLFCAFEGLHATLLITDSLFYIPALQTSLRVPTETTSCKLLSVATWYFRGATYCSLLCEVLYLLRRMLIQGDVEKFKTYLLTAALLPLLPVAALMTIRLWQNPADGIFSSCWIIDDTYTLIIYVPNILILLINLIVLIKVHHRVITSYHAAKRYLPNVVIVKRGVKLAGLLLPVFGMQNFVIIYRPQFWIYYELIESIVIGTQGTIIAVVYCGLNSEIRKEMVRVMQRFRRHRQNLAYGNGTNITGVDMGVANGSQSGRYRAAAEHCARPLTIATSNFKNQSAVVTPILPPAAVTSTAISKEADKSQLKAPNFCDKTPTDHTEAKELLFESSNRL